MKSILEIVTESSNVTSNINWLVWDENILNNVYKDIVDECLNNKKTAYYKVNILVIAKEKKKTGEVDKFRGEYKIMTSEMVIRWSNDRNIIEFWPKNISENGIIMWTPMNEALPTSYK